MSASSASPVGSSDPDEASASQERSAEEPSPSAGASPESAGAGSGVNDTSGVACAPAEGTGAPRAGETSSGVTTALAEDTGSEDRVSEEAGAPSSQPTDLTGESAGVPHATSPTVPDASVDTGRTALSACHGVSSGPRSSTGVAIRHPECVRKRYSDHVMTLPPATDVGPSGPSTTTSNAPRTAMCAPPASSMIATKLGSDARLAANADVSSCNRTGRSAPSTMSSQNRWASAS